MQHVTSDLSRHALLLPESALEAQYAAAVHRFIRRGFARSMLIEIERRVFDADVGTVLLLAAKRGARGRMRFMRTRNAGDLVELLAQPSFPHPASGDPMPRARTVRRASSSRAIKTLLSEIARHADVMPLGNVADVRLGVVTGANEFFVRPVHDAAELAPGHVRRVVPRSGWLASAVWTVADHCERDRNGEPSRLLCLPIPHQPNTTLEAAIADSRVDKLHLRSHCAKRAQWWSLKDVAPPDAFLPYMGASPPALVQNAARATCTNAVHRVWWQDATAGDAAIASSWTALFALAVELEARTYGGGILKLDEPATAQRLLIVGKSAATAGELDERVRTAGRAAAFGVGRQATPRGRV